MSTFSNQRSPLKSHRQLRAHIQQTLGSSQALAQAVRLPLGEDHDEWLALHVVDFYNQINMLYGTITEFCSPQTCPRMTATAEYEYLWQDPLQRQRQPTHMSAPGYVEVLMQWIQGFLDDEGIFPTKMGVPFPSQFVPLVKTIMKRLFRVYAHVYCHHFDEVNELGMQTHLNTSLKHFVLFCKEFNLLQRKDYGPLDELVDRMIEN
ncbi:Mob1 protein [Martiniozyma asiatica (nom. inval.)]|nr:Mob1 protein [Martiniozyma asiatica]